MQCDGGSSIEGVIMQNICCVALRLGNSAKLMRHIGFFQPFIVYRDAFIMHYAQNC